MENRAQYDKKKQEFDQLKLLRRETDLIGSALESVKARRAIKLKEQIKQVAEHDKLLGSSVKLEKKKRGRPRKL